MRNSLYVVPDVDKVSGGPKTRISLFKNIFEKEGNFIFNKKNKHNTLFRKSEIAYVESATNRINLIDIPSLFFLRLRSKKTIVFIRDIYIELFPEEYTSIRSRITYFFNKLSNFYLTLIATSMVFPTEEMGEVFFQKNKFFPKRPFTDLPPGTHDITQNRTLPNFSEKLGILYLGSLGYTNSGYQNFIDFANEYKADYNFFILSGDKDLKEKVTANHIKLGKVPRKDIPQFITDNNIAYAFHTRPRNMYDDITFPIKVFDFLSFQLPFFTERHVPVQKLLGNDYPLFASFENNEEIYRKIKSINPQEYQEILNLIKETALNNTYDKRYKKLLEQ
ncbi:hypothetical protein K8089_00760 [Aequorivita sp. F47161]|uniref:Uncharacterized protein n=1 Tax=Aequorivita vitellina TaxID=2874475 RepID=A0A9X1QU77_9FLAO|nr:hypothetical protein [Aequorivita vitellina]MCG2417532.1 hypothetical protein [Aequorivita vitellina]